MKKILLASALIFLFISAQSQGIRIGLKGQANTTWLLNKNVFDANDEIDHEASFGANIGASATYMFNDLLGLSLDLMYASVNQHYKGTILGEDYTMKEKLRYIDLPILLKLTSESGPYFEIGPKFSFLMNHTEEFDSDILSSSESYKNDFNSVLFSIALGFGVDIKVAEHHFINVGLRLAYNPGSALKDLGEDNLDSEDHSIIQHASSYKDGGTGLNDPYHYEKTHVATGGLLLGYTYEFGGK
jgi:outer membrane protein W